MTGADVGARLTSGALTNNPFLDGMAQMAAKDTAGGDAATTLTFAHAPDVVHAPHEGMSPHVGDRNGARVHGARVPA